MTIQAMTIFSEYLREENDGKITIIGGFGNDIGISQESGTEIVAPPIMATTFVRFPATKENHHFKVAAMDGEEEIATSEADIEGVSMDVPFRSLAIPMQIPPLHILQAKRIIILLSSPNFEEKVETGSLNFLFNK